MWVEHPFFASVKISTISSNDNIDIFIGIKMNPVPNYLLSASSKMSAVIQIQPAEFQPVQPATLVYVKRGDSQGKFVATGQVTVAPNASVPTFTSITAGCGTIDVLSSCGNCGEVNSIKGCESVISQCPAGFILTGLGFECISCRRVNKFRNPSDDTSSGISSGISVNKL